MAGGPHPQLNGDRLDAIERQIVLRVMATGLGYIAIGVVMFPLVVSPPPGASSAALGRSMILPGLLLTPTVVSAGAWQARRHYRALTRFLREGREPTTAEILGVSRAPRYVAELVAVCGIVFATAFVGIGHLENPWVDLWRTLLASGLIVGAAALMAYLVSERSLGPILATVVTDSPLSPLSFVGRLVAIWAQAALTPLAALVMSPDKVGLDALRWFVLGVGLAFSLLGFIVTGRNTAHPIRVLRAAAERVQGGHLDTVVPAEHGGELGQLVAAFNEMMHGLRERDRLAALFGAHVGADVAKRAMEGDGRLGGETREVTALFVDIDGSTQLAQSLPPDEFVIMLNGFYGVICEVVATEGGLVNKFEGDAALAVFGAPTDQPDHADRALRAARTLRERLAALSMIFPRLDAGIGVATGLVVAGNVGAADRYEYTVIGDAVNQASRLSDMAQEHPGRVIVSEETVNRAPGEYSSWVADGVARLRGREADTALYVPATAFGRDAAVRA